MKKRDDVDGGVMEGMEAEVGGKRLSPLGWLFVLLIRIYQHTLSHLIGGSCRHQPTCSRYGEEAIRKYGAVKGGWMTVKRIGRCHPWGSSGYDPVP